VRVSPKGAVICGVQRSLASIRGLISRWAALVALAVSLVIALWDLVMDDASLIAQFAEQVEADFVQRIADEREAELGGGDLLQHPETQRLVYHRHRRTLEQWSSTRYVPSDAALQQQLASAADELLLEGNFAFYNVKTISDSTVTFRLVPLKLSYPIRNAYLEEVVFLGRYSGDSRLLGLVDTRYFSLLPTRQGINLIDPAGQHICSFRVADASPLRQMHRLWALGLAALALIYGLNRWRQWLGQRFRRSATSELAFIATLWGLRLLLLATGLPGAYVSFELFSPRLLAISWWVPSLGDLLLTAALLAYTAYRFGRLYDHPTLARRWIGAFANQTNAWLALHTISATLGLVVYGGIQWLVALLMRDSTLYLQLTDLTRIDSYSLMLLLALALLMASVFYTIYFLAGLITEVDEATDAPEHWQWAVTLVTGLMLVGISGHVVDLPIYAALKHGLLYLRRRYQGGLDFDLAASFVIVAALAASLSVCIGRADMVQQRTQLVQVANRYADPHDLITEYLFDEAANNIVADRTLWTADSSFADTSQQNTAVTDLVKRLIDNHLERVFTRYAFRIYFFDGAGRRLDRQPGSPPYMALTNQRIRQGTTLSSKLHLVPYEGSLTRYLYVGRFSVVSPAYGRLYLQLELHPKASTTTKLYPQLLVDYSLGRQIELPEAMTIGWYQDGRLLRKDGSDELPGHLDSPPDTTSGVTERDGALWRAESTGEGGLTVAKVNLPTALDRLTSFSLITYCFLLLYGLSRLPGLLWRISSWRQTIWQGSYVRRIQLVMAVFGFLPLLVMWAITSPLFSRMYYEEAQQELRQDLRSVSEYLEADPYISLNLGAQYVWSSTTDLMNRVNALTSNDLNVYRLDGSLFTTTRQYLYQNEVMARYMNPSVYHVFTAGQTAERVVTEQIGRLSYLSGYRVLTDPQGTPVGYVNMPYLARQRVLDTQVNRLSSYVINLYVVLMLALLVSSIFISRGLTYPLRLLKQKLDATRLGFRNERLAWKSQDEIGAIITSYNQMLAKLEANQRDLARSERENAWREMARQVAHEIKNPLTPMRLSIQHLLRLLDEPRGLNEQKQAVERLSTTLLTQVDSLSNIASTFSTFATLPKEEPTEIELNQLLLDVQALYAHSEEAEVLAEVPDKAVTVWADRELLTRALVNLVRNGLQAVTARIESLAEGDVWVSNLRNGAFLQQLPSGHVQLKLQRLGNRALLAVSDNGVGIAPDNRDKIFQPNFSTKTTGMGLGLAITRRLIENIGGTIEFESEPGVGTTFYITLPLHAPA